MGTELYNRLYLFFCLVCRLLSLSDIDSKAGMEEAALDFLACTLIQSANLKDNRGTHVFKL